MGGQFFNRYFVTQNNYQITIKSNIILLCDKSVHEGNKIFIFFSHDARYFPEVDFCTHLDTMGY